MWINGFFLLKLILRNLDSQMQTLKRCFCYCSEFEIPNLEFILLIFLENTLKTYHWKNGSYISQFPFSYYLNQHIPPHLFWQFYTLQVGKANKIKSYVIRNLGLIVKKLKNLPDSRNPHFKKLIQATWYDCNCLYCLYEHFEKVGMLRQMVCVSDQISSKSHLKIKLYSAKELVFFWTFEQIK